MRNTGWYYEMDKEMITIKYNGVVWKRDRFKNVCRDPDVKNRMDWATKTLKILYFEDDHDTTDILSINLKKKGMHVFSASTYNNCTDLIDRMQPDCIICDVYMDGNSQGQGIEAIKNSGIPYFIYTGHPEYKSEATIVLKPELGLIAPVIFETIGQPAA